MAFDVIRNPEIFTDRENTVVIHDDPSWQFFGQADGCKAGDIDLQNFRNFFPYIAQAEILNQNPLGVIPFDIALSPYDVDLNWIDDEFSPNFRGEYNYNCTEGTSWVENFPSPHGDMLAWGQDWFNNQYGLYKGFLRFTSSGSDEENYTDHLCFTQGERVSLTSTSALPSPLSANVPYYINIVTNTIFEFHDVMPVLSALGASVINTTDTGIGIHRMEFLDDLSIHTTRELPGEFWVRNHDKKTVGQGGTALAGVTDNYTWHPTLSAVTFDDGVIDVRLYNNILFMRTPDYAIVERIRIDSDNDIFSLVDESAIVSYQGAFPEPYFKNDTLYFTSFSADNLSLYSYKDNLRKLATTVSAVSATSESLSWDDHRNTWTSTRTTSDGYMDQVEFRACVSGYNVSNTEVTVLGGNYRVLDSDFFGGDAYYIIEDQDIPAVFLAAVQVELDVSVAAATSDACSSVSITTETTSKEFQALSLHYHNQLRGFDDFHYFSGQLVGISALQGARDVSLRQNAISILTKPLSAAVPGGETPFIRQGGADRATSLQYLVTASLSGLSSADTGFLSLPYHAIPLKTLQNNDYKYTCVDTVRDYHSLHFGLQGLNYDRPILGYSSNLRTQTFEPDRLTEFVYPHNARQMPLSASTIACDGAIPGSCPSNSDIIAHHSAQYAFQNSEVLYSWLSGADCNYQWVDRTLENTGNGNFTNFATDAPSQMILEPGGQYTYIRRGRELNNAYIAGLSASLVFNLSGFLNGTALDSSGNGFDSPVVS